MNIKDYTILIIACTIFCLTVFVSACKEDENILRAEANEQFAGGDLTVFDRSSNAFGLPAPNLDSEGEIKFVVGNSFFKQNWVTAPASTTGRDGLGPMLNALSCSGCHTFDGRGKPPAYSGEPLLGLLLRLSIPGQNIHGGAIPEPTYGNQFQGRSIQGVAPEGEVIITYQEIAGLFADGEAYSLRKPTYQFQNLNYGTMGADVLFSPRIAQQLVGLGLLEAVKEADILALADEHDRNQDGISGKPNYVWDVEKNQTVVGRFGWKANEPSIKQQTAGAFNGDIGITSRLFPSDHCTSAQMDCKNAINGNDAPENFELADYTLERVTFYMATLGVPTRRDWDKAEVLKGKQLFFQVGCQSCHIQKFTTGNHTSIPQLSAQSIFPYSDLLLHDLGEGLADGRPDFLASGNEWRTAPLWGIGLIQTVNGHTFLLHDGRARNVQEAILWHGGEAEKSKENFRKMRKTDREALIKFVESL